MAIAGNYNDKNNNNNNNVNNATKIIEELS